MRGDDDQHWPHPSLPKGTSVRVDTTLIGFERLSWVRGNLSFVFRVGGKGLALLMNTPTCITTYTHTHIHMYTHI